MPHTEANSRDGLSTLQALAASFGRHGDREALVAMRRGDPERWTFRELGERVDAMAQGLVVRGIGAGDPVALSAGNRLEWIVSCLAILRAGAVVVPIDSQLADRALAHVLADSGARHVFTTAAEADRVRRLGSNTSPTIFLFDGDVEGTPNWRTLANGDGVPLPEAGPGDDAALFYTSGTTGVPKGVPLTHRNIVFEIDMVIRAELVTAEDRVLLPLPLHHVYPFVVGMLTALAIGLPLILPRALTGPRIVEAVREGRATFLIGVPRLYSALVQGVRGRAASQGRIARGLFETLLRSSVLLQRGLGLRAGKTLLRSLHERMGPDLRVLVSGGAALKPELARTLEGLGWRVATGYGLTETAPILTVNRPWDARFETAGRAIDPRVELRIDSSVAAKSTEEPGGTASRSFGEVLARGPNVFSGYHNLPDETTKAFTEDGWFRTGDLGFLDNEGFLHLAGRVSTMIVTEGGENVQPEDVEEAYQSHPTVREIAVLEDNNKLVALIVPETEGTSSNDKEETERALRAALNDVSRRLPSYQRISSFAVTRETLPRTRLGKLRRHLLRERYERALRGDEGTAAERKSPLPLDEMSGEDRSLIEDPVARATWEWLATRYPDQRLTPDANLGLDLGVDSMEWLNLTLEITERTGIELDERAIARIETVRDLLREVVEAGEAAVQGAGLTSALDNPESVLRPQDKHWLAPRSPLQKAASRAIYGVNRSLMRTLFQLRVEGLEHLPERGPFIIAPNHLSFLDPFALGAALGYARLENTYWAGWSGIAFHNPLTRLFSRLSQTVPIDPDRAVVSSLAFASAVLKRGKALVWFPEGQRSKTGALQRFRPGIGFLLKRFPVPVVPALIEGTREALPVGRAVPRFHPLRVTFCEPLDPAALKENAPDAAAGEQIVQALHDAWVEHARRNAPKLISG